jgi:hypothetical protein
MWALLSMPWATSTCSFSARRVTTGLRSFDRIITGTPELHEAGDAHAVAAVDADLFVAVLVDVGTVVGVDAVEVGDQGVDVDDLRGLLGGGDGADEGEVGHVVDLAGVLGRDLLDADAAEEAVLVFEQAGGAHDVEGAGLVEVLGAVLAAGTVAGLMADGHGLLCIIVVEAPQERVVLDRGEHDIGLVVADRAHRVLDRRRSR